MVKIPEETLIIENARLLASSVILPCGRTVPNRFAKVSKMKTYSKFVDSIWKTHIKVAMYENLTPFWGGLPNQLHKSLYSRWAEGGWGMIITGNFQISASHLTLGRDVVIPEGKWNKAQLKSFEELAVAMHSSNNPIPPLAIMQLSHSGRQSPRIIGGRTISSPASCSSQRVGQSAQGTLTDIANQLMFQTPRILSTKEVEEIAEKFCNAAQNALKAGFDGVQLHAAHGCKFRTLIIQTYIY